MDRITAYFSFNAEAFKLLINQWQSLIAPYSTFLCHFLSSEKFTVFVFRRLIIANCIGINPVGLLLQKPSLLHNGHLEGRVKEADGYRRSSQPDRRSSQPVSGLKEA